MNWLQRQGFCVEKFSYFNEIKINDIIRVKMNNPFSAEYFWQYF